MESAMLAVVVGQVELKASCALPLSAPIISMNGRIIHGAKSEDCVSSDFKREIIALLPRLRRFARTLTRSVPEADDLVHQWDPAQPLDRWLFRIARNLWISEIRKRKVRMGEGQVPAEESHELVTTETGEARVAVAELRGKIASLPEDLASVLLLVSVEGYSYAEASDLLEVPIGTVMSRIHRARKLLTQKIADLEGWVQ